MNVSGTWPPPIKPFQKVYCRVHWRGVWYHLGKLGSKEARDAHIRLLGQWSADPNYKPNAREVLIGELVRDYHEAAPYPPTQEEKYGRVLELLTRHHGTMNVSAFGSAALSALLIDLGKRETGLDGRRRKDGQTFYSRDYLGTVLRVIKDVWRWGVKTERIDLDRLKTLETVDGLKPHQARGSNEVLPVDDAQVEAILPELPRSVAAIVRVQRLTGARPSELFGLRPVFLDRTNPDYWILRLKKHKTAHKKKTRAIVFGPLAQAILNDEWPDDDEGLFFPVRPRVYGPRICPVYGSELRRREAARARTKPHPVGQAYKAGSYRVAVHRACERAGVPLWNPYQLRHSRLTEVRNDHGAEVSAATGGHSLKMNEHYTQHNERLAITAALASG